jgi:hypothetical protein
VLVVTTETGRSIKINPRTVRVDIRAPRSLLATIKEPMVHAGINTSKLGDGVYELTPEIEFDVPDRNKISVQAIVPPRVRIRIQ